MRGDRSQARCRVASRAVRDRAHGRKRLAEVRAAQEERGV